MISKVHTIVPEVAENVRGGIGTVSAHKLLDLYPGSSLKSVALVRLEPGASVGPHSHHGEEDFYYCISGSGVVVDNGLEHPFTPVSPLRKTGLRGLHSVGANPPSDSPNNLWPISVTGIGISP